MEKLVECKLGEINLPQFDDITSLPEGVCPVDRVMTNLKTAGDISCGMSVMCRDGITQLLLIIGDIASGKGSIEDLDLLKEICQIAETTSGCELAKKVSANILYSLENYIYEWEQHCKRKRCTAMICKNCYSLYIDPAACAGCGKCLEDAPKDSIFGGAGMVHVISNQQQLVECNCDIISKCPSEAIKKAIAPVAGLPQQPIPVGSVAEGAPRKRRRER